MTELSHGHEIRPLTGVRGLAAFWVLGYHFIVLQKTYWPAFAAALRPWTEKGFEGVDLFFLLSGFILSYVYPSRTGNQSWAEYRSFLWFRLARIYPNHLATLLILGALVVFARLRGAAVNGAYDLATLPSHLLLLQAWPGFQNSQWNEVSWSISAEWFAYLAIFPLAQRLRARKTLPGWELAGVYLLLGAWLFVAREIGPEAQSLIRVALEFLAGSLLFGFREKNGPGVRFCQRFLLLLFLLWLAVPLLIRGRFACDGLLLLLPLLLLGATAEASSMARLLSTRPALFLGRISYAIYMVHVIVEQCLNRVFPVARFEHASSLARLFVLGAYLAGVLLGATVLYWAIEVPARNALRRLHQRWNREAGSAR